MNLPEMHELEQREPVQWSKCIRCSEDINAGEEYIESAGYHYCGEDCFVKLTIEEGNASVLVAGE